MSSLPAWQAQPYAQALSALEAGRLGHALLFVGAAGLGKRAVAEALTARLLCRSPVAGHACSQCRECRLRIAGTHPDLRRVSFGLRDDGRPRTEIVVDQVRALAEALSMSAQLGGASVALVDPADAMNTNAANALLKTLEEPQPGRYLLLVSDRPSRLPATIRSRCQRIGFAAPPREEAAAWLQAQGHPTAEAAEALALTDGNPGLALAVLESEVLGLRSGVESDLAALARGQAAPFAVARTWLEDRPGQRIELALDLVRRQGWRIAGVAPAERPGLTATADFPKLAAWFDAALRTRELLAGPARPELALGELLLGWQQAAR